MAVSAIRLKTCSGPCGLEKELTEFHITKNGKFGRHPWCKDCKNAQSRERYAGNVEEFRHRSKARGIKSKYGLDPNAYLKMVKEATCDICGTSEPGRGKEFLCIDHDHQTGEIRGTLCIACNLAIGYLRDDPALAMKAASYLSEEGGYHRSFG